MRFLNKISLAACLTTLAGLCLAGESSAPASLDEKSLNLITETASKICAEFSSRGESAEFSAAGELDAELSKLWRNLAKAGVNFKTNYKTEKYQGVLKDQILTAMEESNKCKLDVFHSLQDGIIRTQSQPPRPASPSTNQVTYGNGSHNISNISGGVININGK